MNRVPTICWALIIVLQYLACNFLGGMMNFFGGGVFVMLEIIAPRIKVKQICDYENEMHLFRENGDCKRRDCG